MDITPDSDSIPWLTAPCSTVALLGFLRFVYIQRLGDFVEMQAFLHSIPEAVLVFLALQRANMSFGHL